MAEDIEDFWKIHLEKIKVMRREEDAPVDTMGCHRLGDPLAEPKVYRFQILIALMLSSQTKDEITAAAMERLKKYGCTVEKMKDIELSALEHLLYPVGFYKRKAMYIQNVAKFLSTKDGEIPKTIHELCALSGVGPKMAHLVMLIAWNKCEGIAVDTHVHRIVNRLDLNGQRSTIFLWDSDSRYVNR